MLAPEEEEPDGEEGEEEEVHGELRFGLGEGDFHPLVCLTTATGNLFL